MVHDCYEEQTKELKFKHHKHTATASFLILLNLNLKITFISFVCMCIHRCVQTRCTCEDQRETCSCFFPSTIWAWGLNSARQAWLQVPLLTKQSPWPTHTFKNYLFTHLFLKIIIVYMCA